MASRGPGAEPRPDGRPPGPGADGAGRIPPSRRDEQPSHGQQDLTRMAVRAPTPLVHNRPLRLSLVPQQGMELPPPPIEHLARRDGRLPLRASRPISSRRMHWSESRWISATSSSSWRWWRRSPPRAGAQRTPRPQVPDARWAFGLHTLALVLACCCVGPLLAHHFEYVYVAQYSSRALSEPLTLRRVGGQEGASAWTALSAVSGWPCCASRARCRARRWCS